MGHALACLVLSSTAGAMASVQAAISAVLLKAAATATALAAAVQFRVCLAQEGCCVVFRINVYPSRLSCTALSMGDQTKSLMWV